MTEEGLAREITAAWESRDDPAGAPPELGKLVHHSAGPTVGVGGRLAGGHGTCPLRRRFDDDPLDEGPAQVEPEVPRRQRAVHPPSSVSTAPVVKRAPGPHR